MRIELLRTAEHVLLDTRDYALALYICRDVPTLVSCGWYKSPLDKNNHQYTSPIVVHNKRGKFVC